MLVTVEKRKRKRGTSVLLSYLDNQGKRRRKVVGTAATLEALKLVEADADRERKRIEHELAQGKHAPEVGEGSLEVALLEFVKYQADSNVRESTIRAYRTTLKRWRAFLKGKNIRRLKEVTPKLIAEFVVKNSDKAPDTVSSDLGRIKRMFRYFVDRELLLSNPLSHTLVREVWPQRVPHERAFTVSELAKFTELAAKPNRSPYQGDFLDFFRLLAETGLRCGEALHLRWCDISFAPDGGYLRVQPWGDWKPKTKKSIRAVPLSPAVHDILSTRLRGLGEVDPVALVFPGHWENRRIGIYFNRLLRKAKMDDRDGRGQKLRLHSFRHHFATRLVASGADPATVRDLMGHASIVTTNRYFNVPRSELHRAMDGAFTRTQSVHDSSGVYRFPAEVGQ